MPKMMVKCPNCKQPIQADIVQLFDVTDNPMAKGQLLSGAVNLIECQFCGFRGNYPTPIVYHDSEKEMLLTFVPPEVGLPKNEQERIIGSLINQVMNKLPQDKRKAYLLQPQASLTLQGMVEKILEADGISKEMIQAQQDRLNLIQRLANLSPDACVESIKQEDGIIDADFFAILERLMESASLSGDQESAKKLSELQKLILENSTHGKELVNQIQEIEEAIKTLKSIGDEVTREQLLDVIIKAPNETRLRALASMARPGIDYVFFQMLSDRVERARGDGRNRLIQLRENLLKITEEIDHKVAEESKIARKLIEKLIEAENIPEATIQILPQINEIFIQEINSAMSTAKDAKDEEKQNKLSQIIGTIQQASNTSQVIEFIQTLLGAPDEKVTRQILEENSDMITQEFLNMLANLTYQIKSGNDVNLAQKMSELNNLVLRFSMEKNLQKD